MTDDSLLPFSFPAAARKKITAAFDGGRITSDAGVMLLGQAERRLGLADKLARVIADMRNPSAVTHSVSSILRARILAIGCGYEDGNDLDHLRKGPAFKLACGRLPDSGKDLCSQPTMSRWENAPTLREIIKLFEDRRAHRRDRKPRQTRPCFRLPTGQPVPEASRRPAARWPPIGGANAPFTRPINPNACKKSRSLQPQSRATKTRT